MSYFGTTKINKMFLGTTEIGKAYLGTNLVFQKGGQPVEMIQYIRGGYDGSYIDTGITADNTVKVIVWARNFNPGAGPLFGSRVAVAQDTFSIGANPAINLGRIRVDYAQSSSTYANDQFVNLSHYHKYELYQGVLKVDDSTVATATTGTFSNSHNIHILGLNNNGSHSACSYPIDIIACKIYKNDILVRDYTAVNSPSVGLYDSVSDTVFTNAGSGSFTYGEFNPNAYTPLEYVESTGQQYFDIGIKGSNSLGYIIKFMPLQSTGWPCVFGAQTNGSTKRYELSQGNTSIAARYFYLAYNTGSVNYDNTSSMNNNNYVITKSGNNYGIYLSGANGLTSKITGSFTAATFTTDYNIAVGANNQAGSISQKSSGRYYFLSFGSSRNFVPAKKNSKIGMYDTYNDVFYESISGTPFVAGPTL